MRDGVRAILFDCDGVLFDSRKANERYYNRIRSEMGLPPLTEEEVEIAHMQTASEVIRYLFRDHPDLLPAAFEFYRRLDYTPYLRYMVMEPDLPEVFRHLRKAYKTGLITNRTTTLPRLLALHGLKPLFDVVLSALDVERPKPHPDPLRKALNLLELSPLQAVYVGDSIIDEQAARAAGLPFVAFRNPALKADLHIDRLADLKSYF